MKQVQHMMRRWVKGFVTASSMFIFSLSLASGNDLTVAPNNGTPYSYSDPSSTAPSYNDVGRPVEEETQSLMLNNEALGLEGPVTISTGYSANYGYELNASFSHRLGFYDAISLLGAYAPQENRVDITWAHAWTDNQRTKLSVERLEEAMDFDYNSGSVTEWVPQYSYGAGYQYLFNKNWLKNVELSGYYAKAQSQDLSTIQFTNENGTFDNYRHIAGATSKGSEATLNISPWKTGLVGLGLNYDSVNYNTKYSDTDAEDSSGLGFTLSLEQLLSKHVKLNLEGSQREVYDDYLAGVSFLTPSNLEVGVNGERTLGENGSASDSRFNLNLAYFFDDKNRYENGYTLEDPNQSDLASWASKSAAYMDEVLAAADQQTVQVNNSLENNNPTLQSTDSTPTLALTVGEVNHIDISAYIASANLTDAQKQATPVIKGGPSGVEFTYDNATETLSTTTEVPESALGKEATPLVLVFPTESTNERILAKGTLRDAFTDSLTFKVTVGGNAPTLNSNFDGTQKPILGMAKTWVFKYQNTSNPTDPAAMFINGNPNYTILTMSNGYPSKGTSDPNNCYSFASNTEGDATQTLTITGKASEVCPGNASITVKTTNGAYGSPVQTITFTAQPADTPSISGGAITSPAILENQAYSPGHTFTTTEVSPGKDQKFDTTVANTYVKVFDAGINGTSCTDVTSAANWNLGFTNNDTQAILQSGGPVPSSLVGHQLKIYLHVTNDATPALTADNGTTSNCGGTPFTATVEGAPAVPGGLDLGTATIDTTYPTYDFMAHGVTTGSSPLDTSPTASYGTFVVDGNTVSSQDLGLNVNVSSNDVTLTGVVNPGYAGKIVNVTLNLKNTQGYSNSNTTADTLAIVANPAYAPSVAGGQTLMQGAQYSTYTYTFPNTGTDAVTAGTSEKFDTDPAVTYATVTDSVTQEDLSSKFSLTFDADATQITLTSGANTLPTQDRINVVLHVANIDGQTADNAANPDHFDVTSNPAPEYQPTVNGGLALTNGIQYEDYTSYTFATADVNPGSDASQSFLTDSASTYAVVTDPNGTAYSTADANSPFALAFSNNNTQITLNGVAGKALDVQGQWSVVLHVKNTAQNSASNTTPDTFQVTANADFAPVEGDTGNALTNAVVNGGSSVTYNYTGYASSPMLPGPNGSNESFNTTATKALVYYTTDTTKSNPLSGFSLVFNANSTAITGLTASSATIAGLTGPVNVYYQAVNNDNPDNVVTSTVPDTIATDMISVTNPTTMAPATVATPYSYSFKDSAPLTTGSTGLSASSTVTFSDPNAGLSYAVVDTNADGVYDDVQVTGTPLAGHAGTITLTLNLNTPDTALPKTTTATVLLSGTTPAVIAGTMPGAQLNQPYRYDFANTGAGGATGPVVSAGAGEYFDENATTFTVTGATSGDLSGSFHLEYSSSASVQGNAASNGHDLVSLVSNGNLTTADTLTVTFHVVNADAQNVNGTPGTVAVGSVTGYLSCPPSAQIGNARPTTTTSNLYSASTGGSILSTVTFNRGSYDGSKAVQLQVALISVAGNQTTLTCKYNNPLDTPTPYDYVSTTIITTVDANGVQGVVKGVDGGWDSKTSPTQCNVTNETATSCQVKYTYAG